MNVPPSDTPPSEPSPRHRREAPGRTAGAGPARGTVRIDTGLVSGVPGALPGVTVYRGIPYAASTAGPDRWRPPRPAPSWEGVRAADTFGDAPPQAGTGFAMSEDCLNLNVWTAASAGGERRPVYVWIFGGGFSGGRGSDPVFDGSVLAGKGLVVVTFNYRLGALGFLATPGLSRESAHRASGNYGLLDQIAALEWVRRNISAFGGDPDQVSIGGQSAGAGSAGMLSLSPLAAGLFRRTVAQSHARHPGDPELRYLGTSYRRLDAAERQGAAYAAAHGATTPDELRALPWQDLDDAGTLGDDGVDTRSAARPPLFRPVLDGWVLPAGYHDTYARGAQNDVWYLAGNNLDETGAVPETAFDHWRRTGRRDRPGAPPVHVTLDDFVGSARHTYGALAMEFLRLYPAATDDEAARAANDAVRDRSRATTHLWGTQWVRGCGRPVHTYFWTHRPPGPDHDIRGAGHGSEIPYFFGTLHPADQGWTGRDREIADTMSSYLANYVATGDPNGPGLPAWPAYDPRTPTVMEVGAHFGPIPVAPPAELDFWKRYFAAQQPW
ncbi:putative carboxylesterase [Actinacidiphila reveromycinica]|uniref:Carboxylic ester hydrolase n=1 Tax=Actinacidiphila reveromycinica TaxID=659352 RepID=A0A7U3VSH1_9ACTN|nr:carboxylesterase family protein [Streptomyces sp. SN-593]BBB01886.1 putative carboxylesterase [Streptomyces sp. SN-593]